MKFDPSELSGDTDEIISLFIDYITRTDEEIEDEKDRGQRKTQVKIFLANNHGFELGSLTDEIEYLAQTEGLSEYIQRYITEHNFHEDRLGDDVSYVEIDTPKRARTDQFVFIDDGDYLRVITAERRKWTEKTVEKLIQYLPSLERVFLTPSDLEDIVSDLYGTSVAGFTAKYHSYKTDKRASIRFHGGTDEDLEKVENVFDAKPTRLEFNQRNSPEAAVRSSVAQEGHFTFSSVRPGSEDRGAQTLEELSKGFEAHDEQNYKVEHRPVRETFKNGLTIEGGTTLRLIDDSEDYSLEQDTADFLEERILDHKRRYEYSVWEHGNYFVFDKDTGEPFEITVEDEDIHLHAKETTTSTTFRNFCSLVFEEFDSTYSLEKNSRRLKA
ncbi:hypothetical protein [Haloferax sp. ATB1]|uniref:hypothetical protein n=1 Tax=Haloferax sp. ATB1 TaxID=1508454 RepID=UPI0005B1D1E7|nr:hypothetical protein [Haloferax sp. ATB1]